MTEALVQHGHRECEQVYISEDQWARARMHKLILNVMDVRAGKKKVPTGRGQDGGGLAPK